jgi:hypothetical protein
MTIRGARRKEINRCDNSAMHPTNHPTECTCDHCWEEEMDARQCFGLKLTTKAVWKRRKTEAA